MKKYQRDTLQAVREAADAFGATVTVEAGGKHSRFVLQLGSKRAVIPFSCSPRGSTEFIPANTKRQAVAALQRLKGDCTQ